jgi:micrococcal nuclease
VKLAGEGRRVDIGSPWILTGLWAMCAIACGPVDEPENQDCGPEKATVVRVIDGDTVELAGGERVRYLLVDTPEITNGHDDCFGAEAAEFNSQLVLDKQVELRYDVECRDLYDRLLAYVFVQDRELNALLVERGYACVLHIAPNGNDRVEEFERLQTQAIEQNRGMWGVCEEVSCAR